MTRLRDALARAAAAETGAGLPETENQTATPDVPGTWRFDVEPVSGAMETDAPRSMLSPADVEPDIDLAEPMPDMEYPFATAATARKLVVGPKPDHTLVEQYRHLAAALHHAQLRSGARTVMVTSAVEAEGKTTTAVNLALTMSHSHRRQVLLIDADLRRPSIHNVLQLGNKAGLSDMLAIGRPAAGVPLQRVSPTLSVLTAGRPTSDPMSALVSETMKDFIHEAAQRFDWVVIDTPPIALLSDANLLASMIDLALLVVRANTTGYPLARRAVESIGHDRLLGVVLNRSKRSDLTVGYGYYYYGYSYRPKEEQRQGQQKRGWLRRLLRREK